MLEFNPLYYKQKPSAKYNLIFFFCNFIIDFLSFWRCSTKGAALRKEPHSSSSSLSSSHSSSSDSEEKDQENKRFNIVSNEDQFK